LETLFHLVVIEEGWNDGGYTDHCHLLRQIDTSAILRGAGHWYWAEYSEENREGYEESDDKRIKSV